MTKLESNQFYKMMTSPIGFWDKSPSSKFEVKVVENQFKDPTKFNAKPEIVFEVQIKERPFFGGQVEKPLQKVDTAQTLERMVTADKELIFGLGCSGALVINKLIDSLEKFKFELKADIDKYRFRKVATRNDRHSKVDKAFGNIQGELLKIERRVQAVKKAAEDKSKLGLFGTVAVLVLAGAAFYGANVVIGDYLIPNATTAAVSLMFWRVKAPISP